MPQKTRYPDPAQLRTFSESPMPFHEVTTRELNIRQGNSDYYSYLVATFDNVTYRYRPTQILVEVNADNRRPIEEVLWANLGHLDAWRQAIDVQIEEDFVCVTEFLANDGELYQYSAYWILEDVVISRPEE